MTGAGCRAWSVLFTLLLLGAVTFELAGCRRTARPSPKPPIIVIIIDTLRADHVGAYGYARPTTPNLDRFSAGAIRFANAHAASSWTVPSMASLFTGVSPWNHGVVKAEADLSPEQVGYQLTLNDQFVTLAETLKAAGYETYGVTANYHLHEKYGMAQGFDHYEAFGFRDREPVDLQLKDWLAALQRTRRQGKPYFLFIHYFDPHHPYFPIEPFINEWRPNYDRQEIQDLAVKNFRGLLDKGYFLDNADKMQLLVDLYDSEIRACDDSVGRWLGELPDVGRALVLITSDHGEAFGDHRNMIHGSDLYGETLRVPLWLRLPDGKHAGAVVNEHVSLLDIYPTLAAVVGAKPPDYVEGVDLLPVVDQKAPATRLLFAATERATDQVWRAAIRAPYKLVYHVNQKRKELYDLSADPSEQHDLAATQPDLAEELFAALVRAKRPKPRFAPGTAGTISPELRRQLTELGYL
jgi:arylsulfatase A-like enzyme